MFERPHHQFIEVVLTSLDSELFHSQRCWFGGGTAIALRKGEYRESVDIDFLVDDVNHFLSLRNLINWRTDMSPLLRLGAPKLALTREWRVDQYGLRCAIDLGPRPIKFEIVQEARIKFDASEYSNTICGLGTLADQDLAACKLLANADRWRDESVFSRDVIDLAYLDLSPSEMAPSVAKAVAAYGNGVVNESLNAIQNLREQERRLARCIQALSIADPVAMVVQRLRTLDRRLRLISKQMNLA